MGKNNIIYLVIGIIVIAGFFLLLRTKTSAPTFAPSSTESTNSAEQSSAKTFDLVVKNKKLVSGPDTLTVTEGMQVTFNVTNDEDEELHIHGYDKSVDLEASKAATLTFTANLTGRFPFELEKSKTELGALEVQPK